MRLLQVASILLLYKNLQSDQQNNTDDTQNSTGNSHTAVLQLGVIHSQAAGHNSYSTRMKPRTKKLTIPLTRETIDRVFAFFA